MAAPQRQQQGQGGPKQLQITQCFQPRYRPGGAAADAGAPAAATNAGQRPAAAGQARNSLQPQQQRQQQHAVRPPAANTNAAAVHRSAPGQPAPGTASTRPSQNGAPTRGPAQQPAPAAAQPARSGAPASVSPLSLEQYCVLYEALTRRGVHSASAGPHGAGGNGASGGGSPDAGGAGGGAAHGGRGGEHQRGGSSCAGGVVQPVTVVEEAFYKTGDLKQVGRTRVPVHLAGRSRATHGGLLVTPCGPSSCQQWPE